MTLRRSLLFVPGQRQAMLDKAMGLALDVVLLDLEDAVPPAEKAEARTRVAAYLERAPGGPARYVRLNAVATGHLDADLEAVLRPGLIGVMLPKVDSPDEVRALAARLDQRERAAGLAARSVRIIPCVESARAVIAAPAIAASGDRVEALMFGSEDYANDLGLPIARDGEAADLLYARSAVVNAATAARVASFDGPWPVVRDLDGLRRQAQQARRLGFTGKTCIHPDQIGPVNEAFAPTAAEVERARRVVAEFDAAAARGQGVLAVEGLLVDAPVADRARRVLREHDEVRAAG